MRSSTTIGMQLREGVIEGAFPPIHDSHLIRNFDLEFDEQRQVVGPEPWSSRRT